MSILDFNDNKKSKKNPYSMFGESSKKSNKLPSILSGKSTNGSMFGLPKEKEKDPRRAFTKGLEKKAFSERGAKATCDRCHKEFAINVLEKHHKKAHSKGGKSVSSNLMVLCPLCHKEIHLEEKNYDERKPKDSNPFGIKPIMKMKW